MFIAISYFIAILREKAVPISLTTRLLASQFRHRKGATMTIFRHSGMLEFRLTGSSRIVKLMLGVELANIRIVLNRGALVVWDVTGVAISGMSLCEQIFLSEAIHKWLCMGDLDSQIGTSA